MEGQRHPCIAASAVLLIFALQPATGWGSSPSSVWLCAARLAEQAAKLPPADGVDLVALDPRIAELGKVLESIDSGDQKAADRLIAERGRPVIIEVDDLGGDRGSKRPARVDGLPATRLPGLGYNNAGTFAVDRGPAVGRTVLKIFGHHDGKTVQFNRPVALIEEWRLALLGEWVGGPKVVGGGLAQIKTASGERLGPYLELEHLAPEGGVSLKQGLRDARFLDQAGDHAAVGAEVARLLMRAILTRIDPSDPDFMIARTGSGSARRYVVRWLDTGDWRLIRPRKMLRALAARTVVISDLLGDAPQARAAFLGELEQELRSLAHRFPPEELAIPLEIIKRERAELGRFDDIR